MLPQKCEVTCEVHAVPWLLMSFVSPGYWGGKIATLSPTPYSYKYRCCWRILRRASEDGFLKGEEKAGGFLHHESKICRDVPSSLENSCKIKNDGDHC